MKVLLVCAALIGCIALGWVITANEVAQYRVLAPIQANSERQVYENTNSYNRGMQQQLDQYEMQYDAATADQKAAMRPIILHEFAGYDTNRLTPDEYNFYEKLKGENE